MERRFFRWSDESVRRSVSWSAAIGRSGGRRCRERALQVISGKDAEHDNERSQGFGSAAV